MQVRPSSEYRSATAHGTAYKRPAAPAANNTAPPSTTTLPTHTPQNILHDTLSTALAKHMAKLRKPAAAAPSNSNQMANLSKSMLKARIEMLRKMMALAGNDPGSLRALAQQLAQASRELKSLSGGSGNAAPTLPQQPVTAASADGQAETAQAASEALPETGALMASLEDATNSQPGENERSDENQTQE